MKKIVNSEDLSYLMKQDSILAKIHSEYGEPPNWERQADFVSLSKIILEQQVSLASAKAHFQKLNTYLTEFTPETLLKLTDEDMRKCQISRQKAKYLKEISEAVLSGKLNFEALNQSEEWEVREILTSITGIGNWTTDIYLLFCLQQKDIFPIGDIAIRNSIKELYGVTTLEEIIDVAETGVLIVPWEAILCGIII
jgi:DNA-3-methyladenine glycosylase II